MSQRNILYHWLVEQSKSLAIHGSHCSLDWNNNNPNCWWPTIYPEALCGFDCILPCTRMTHWGAPGRGFSLSSWSDWDHIEGMLFLCLIDLLAYFMSRLVGSLWTMLQIIHIVMSKLEEELKLQNIPFDEVGRRIRSVKWQDFELVVWANYCSIDVSPTSLIWPVRPS